MTIEIKFAATDKDICMMCHFSSECPKCCNKCDDPCNVGQSCGFNPAKGSQAGRLIAWRNIIALNDSFDRLKKYAQNRKVGSHE